MRISDDEFGEDLMHENFGQRGLRTVYLEHSSKQEEMGCEALFFLMKTHFMTKSGDFSARIIVGTQCFLQPQTSIMNINPNILEAFL